MKREGVECHKMWEECHLFWLDYLVHGFGNCVDDTPTETGLKKKKHISYIKMHGEWKERNLMHMPKLALQDQIKEIS